MELEDTTPQGGLELDSLSVVSETRVALQSLSPLKRGRTNTGGPRDSGYVTPQSTYHQTNNVRREVNIQQNILKGSEDEVARTAAQQLADRTSAAFNTTESMLHALDQQMSADRQAFEAQQSEQQNQMMSLRQRLESSQQRTSKEEITKDEQIRRLTERLSQ
jgi:glycerol-3-phosphate dehydrogenase